jgi:hypothetical protein
LLGHHLVTDIQRITVPNPGGAAMSFSSSSRERAIRRKKTTSVAAVLGSLSAAVAFVAAAGSVQAAPTAAGAGLAAGPTLAVGAPAPVPQGAVRIGTEPAGAVLHLDVILQPRDPAALTRYATQVATPGSPFYHDYLPRGAFASAFGPTATAIRAVRASLTAIGLRPGKITANHLSFPVTATAATVERAFRTTIGTFRLAGGGHGYANTSALRLPASAAPYVQAVAGLDSLVRLAPLLAKPSQVHVTRSGQKIIPQDNTGGPKPCQSALNEQASIYSSNGGTKWVLTADQMAYDYEFSPLYKSGDFGKGQTVAIVELGDSNSTRDIADYQSCYGTHVPVAYENIDGFKNSGAGEGEAALDIETVAVMAPGVHIVVYRSAGSNNAQWYDTFGTVAIQDIARTESVSYGLCESLFPTKLASALNVIFEQQAVQGQTVLISSGDTGSEGCLRPEPGKRSLLSAEFPASDPFVLSVGGTSITSPNPVPRQLELVWNDAFDGNGAGGGGRSAFFAEPSYQRAFGIKSNVRQVPDVSGDADPETGYLIVHKGGWLQVGGTSASTPLWAALMALTDSKCSSSPVGFVNPLMYYVASPAVKAIVLNDIVTNTSYPGNVSNDYTGLGGGEYPVLPGYDMATGLGTPIGGVLSQQLCKFSAEPGGYRVATAKGNVYSFNAAYHGSLSGKKLAARVAGIADDPANNGYWLVTAKGSVSGFGVSAHGSAKNPASPVVGIAATPNGKGYWLVTAKGHVYAFDALFRGSVKGSLASPVVGIAADPFTGGYWVVTAKGKVYAFDAGNYRGKSLSGVTGIAADTARQGYWLVTSKGSVHGFNVNSLGSMPVGNLFGNVVGITGDHATGGYWLVTRYGIVAGFGATVHGVSTSFSSSNPVVGIAGTHQPQAFA